MEDVVSRVPTLSFIDMSKVMVFARGGRTHAEGAYATCHCISLPASEPGYYFWRDRSTGQMTRRSEWFVTKSPQVRIGGTRVKYLISFVLPRFCDQSLQRSRKSDLYASDAPGWLAKLDTIVHELYHIDPDESGIRRVSRSDGTDSPRSHGPHFYEDVAEMVDRYVKSGANPDLFDFLRHDFNALTARYGGVVATTFKNFPSFPQRYMEPVDMPPADPLIKVERLKPQTQPIVYTEDDLHIRHFTDASARRLTRKGQHRAA